MAEQIIDMIIPERTSLTVLIEEEDFARLHTKNIASRAPKKPNRGISRLYPSKYAVMEKRADPELVPNI